LGPSDAEITDGKVRDSLVRVA